jgi:hypothetical protein
MYADGLRASKDLDAASGGRRHLIADLIAGLTTGITSLEQAAPSLEGLS